MVVSSSVSVAATLNQAEPGQLVGLGLHQETGRDIYLGALYLPMGQSRPANLAELAGPRTMEYRVVARRTSIRSLLGSIMLQSEIATGRPPTESTTEFADTLLSRIQGSLYKGDSLQIALNEAQQTEGSLNGYRLAVIDDPEVANYFLIGWLQERGPTTAFRTALLSSRIDDALRAQLEATSATAGRNAQVALWAPARRESPRNDGEEAANEAQRNARAIAATAEVNESTLTSDAAARAGETAQEEVGSLVAAVDATTITDAKPITEEKPIKETIPLASAAAVIADTTESALLEGLATGTDSATSTVGSGDATSPATEAGGLEPADSTALNAPLPAINLDNALPSDDAARTLNTLDSLGSTPTSLALTSQDLGSIELDAEVLSLGVREYSRRLSAFHNNLVARVYRAIRYPKRAIRRSLEGRLELDITLRKSGELVAVSVAQSSGHSLLDEAAVEAAESALANQENAPVDVVAVAEFGSRDGRVVVPVPVSFQLTEQ